mgnify:CR=1 FL=1
MRSLRLQLSLLLKVISRKARDMFNSDIPFKSLVSVMGQQLATFGQDVLIPFLKRKTIHYKTLGLILSSKSV